MSLFNHGGQDKTHNQKAKGVAGDRQQLDAIFSAIEDGLLLIDNKGTIVLFNPAAGSMTGWQPEDAINIGVGVIFRLIDERGKQLPTNDNPFNKVFAVGQTIRDNTLQLINKDNKVISLGLSITPIKDSDGNLGGAVALVRNITQERAEEERLADFISTASHEMRTPVAAIEGYLALALNDKVATVDSRARDYLDKAHSSTEHLGKLFQDLLTSAKAEDGRITSHPIVVEVGNFLRNLTEDLKFQAEKHGLQTEFVVGSTSIIKAQETTGGERQVPPLYYAYIDPDRLREVITNLFDNAVKYTDEGSITIGLTGDEQVVQFYIKDTGSGIPGEDIPHLFQKFYRVDNTATRTIGGTGLGLFICRKIIELYNGRIWVESEENKGSTFYINLPRLTAQKAKELTDSLDNPQTITPTNSTLAVT